MIWNLDPNTVMRDFMRAAARVAPAQLLLARHTLERVPPEKWSLEWFLPYWLGDTWGLDETRARQFVLGNVLGLASLRLQDDLTDDGVAPGARADAAALAVALENAALETYHLHFDASAEFWAHAHALLQEWREATTRVNRLKIKNIAALRDLTSEQAQTLARLGSPLKIGGIAVCLLTAHECALPTLHALLDHALVAAVLHDHAADWELDLAAGRRNLFVAALAPLPQTRACQTQNHARVVQAWMTSQAPRVYFSHIAFHIQRARAHSQTLHCAPLTAHLDGFLANIWRTHDSSARFYHDQLDEAAAKLFGARYRRETARGRHTAERHTRKEVLQN